MSATLFECSECLKTFGAPDDRLLGTPCTYCKVGRLRIFGVGLETDQAKVEEGAGMLVCDRCLEPYSQYLSRQGAVGDLCSVCGVGHLHPYQKPVESSGELDTGGLVDEIDEVDIADVLTDAGYEVAFDVPSGTLDAESRSWHLMACDQCDFKERMSLTVESIACPKKCKGVMRPVDHGIARRIAGYDHGELPIDLFVTAQRATKKVVRFLKAQYGDLKTTRRDCVFCRQRCILALSTDQEIVKAETLEAKRVEVICHECCRKHGIDPENAGMTEGQVAELASVLMKRTVARENAN